MCQHLSLPTGFVGDDFFYFPKDFSLKLIRNVNITTSTFCTAQFKLVELCKFNGHEITLFINLK